MGARTTARESALQMLFAIDTTANDPERVISDYWRETPGDSEGREYADGLVRGVRDAVGDIDAILASASDHWRLDRMTRVDRNILRIGAFELTRCPNVPRAVVLDEAVELAKRYGSEESGAFVNGVLDRVAEDCGRRDDVGSTTTA